MLNLRERYNFYTSSETFWDVIVFDLPDDNPDKRVRHLQVDAAYSHTADMKARYPNYRVSLETYQHSWIVFTDQRPKAPDKPYRLAFQDAQFYYFATLDEALFYILKHNFRPSTYDLTSWSADGTWRTWVNKRGESLQEILLPTPSTDLDQRYRITLSDSKCLFFKSADSAITYVRGAGLKPDQFQFEYHDGSSWRIWTAHETNQTLNDLLLTAMR